MCVILRKEPPPNVKGSSQQGLPDRPEFLREVYLQAKSYVGVSHELQSLNFMLSLKHKGTKTGSWFNIMAEKL